jgi:predicted membrane protein
MAFLLIAYLTLLAIGLSLYHSYRVITKAAAGAATVNAIQAGVREKRLLLWALAAAACYGVGLYVITFFREGLSVYVVLTPLVYLVVWALPRLFLQRLE